MIEPFRLADLDPICVPECRNANTSVAQVDGAAGAVLDEGRRGQKGARAKTRPRQPRFTGCWKSMRLGGKRNVRNNILTRGRLERHESRMNQHSIDDFGQLFQDLPHCDAWAENEEEPKRPGVANRRSSPTPVRPASVLGAAGRRSSPIPVRPASVAGAAEGPTHVLGMGTGDVCSRVGFRVFAETFLQPRYDVAQPEPPRSAPSRLGDREDLPHAWAQPRHGGPRSEGSFLASPNSKGRVDIPAVRAATRAYEAVNGKQPFLRARFLARKAACDNRADGVEDEEAQVLRTIYQKLSGGHIWAKSRKIAKWDFCRTTGPWANRMRAGSLQNYRQWGPDGPQWALQGAK